MVTWKHKTLAIAVACVTCLPHLRELCSCSYSPNVAVPKKTVILTGCTGNIGRVLVGKLANNNQRVIMAARDMNKCLTVRREMVYKTQNKSLVCYHLDLSSFESIKKFADEVKKTETRLDVLINAAAIKEPPLEKELTKEGIEKTFMVNYVGPFVLTHQLLDFLIQTSSVTKDARVVNLVGKPKSNWILDRSDINFVKREYIPEQAYKQSKLALAYFTILLDKFLAEQKHSVFVYGIDFMFKKVGDATNHGFTLSDYSKIMYQNYFYANPDKIGGAVINAALNESLGNRDKSGKRIGLFQLTYKWKYPANNLEEAKRVWNYTTSIIKP